MERKNKECWNCGKFEVYYKKGFCNFIITNHGFCRDCAEIIQKHGYCDRWITNKRNIRQRKAVALRALNEILSDMAAIKQIFEEEKSE